MKEVLAVASRDALFDVAFLRTSNQPVLLALVPGTTRWCSHLGDQACAGHVPDYSLIP